MQLGDLVNVSPMWFPQNLVHDEFHHDVQPSLFEGPLAVLQERTMDGIDVMGQKDFGRALLGCIVRRWKVNCTETVQIGLHQILRDHSKLLLIRMLKREASVLVHRDLCCSGRVARLIFLACIDHVKCSSQPIRLIAAGNLRSGAP